MNGQTEGRMGGFDSMTDRQMYGWKVTPIHQAEDCNLENGLMGE